jgi:inner membrane protein
MPSPIGHALAGVAVVYAADAIDGRRSSPKALAMCAALAMLPDADLLLPGTHRTATHSVTAACVTFIVAAAVTGRVTRLRASRFGAQARGVVSRVGAQARGVASRVGAQARWRTAVLAGAAYASHLLLDWLGADNFPPRGIQLLWPWSDRWFISDLDVFLQTARQYFFTWPIVQQNVVAVAQEIAILLPIVAALWLVRVKTAPRLASELAGRDHPPE